MKSDNHNGVQNSNNSNEYLKREYVEEYYNLYTILHKRVEDREVLDDVMQDILGLLYDAQKENRIPERIYGDTRDEFCNKVLQVLPQNVKEVKQVKQGRQGKQKSIIIYRVIIGLLCCGFAGFIIVNKLWEDGTIGTFKDGFQYFMDNRNYIMEYQSTPTYPEVEVDLYNLDSNKGKLIYENGQATISIENMEQDVSGNYHVTFRARGNYSKNGGTLITPIFNKSLENDIKIYTLNEYQNQEVSGSRIVSSSESHDFDEVLVGKLQVFIDGSPYACRAGLSDAFKYKDGDIFEFQLFTDEYYGENGFILQDELNQQNGKVTLRLYNLVQASWERVDSNRKK